MCAKVKVSCDSKTPCSRCASRNLSCSYGRFCTDSSHLAQAHTNSTKADGMDLTFLLACTDPAVGTVDEVILTGEPERDGDNATSHVDRDVPSGTIDPNLLFLGFMDPYFGTEMEFNRMDDGMPTPLSLDLDMDEALFLTQVSLLEAELRQTAAAERTRSRREFDSDIWASFFTPQNFRECINAFFHRDQLLATIIHRPTFHSDRADSTLLLSIVLSGYSYIQAGSRKGFNPVALALRKIAEEYIFHRVGQHLSPTVASPAPQFALELCQAAYIIVTLQSCVKDAKIRQHVTTKCHPMLVALLRNLDMIGITHARSETSDWRAFIYKESCIRLVHWTFINDAWLNLFSNYPPAMTLLDMSGDLPCDDEFWFMEDPTVAHDTFMEKINSNVQGVSLKLLMSELLGDGWAPSTVALYKQLDVKHFLVAIFGELLFYNIQNVSDNIYQPFSMLYFSSNLHCYLKAASVLCPEDWAGGLSSGKVLWVALIEKAENNLV